MNFESINHKWIENIRYLKPIWDTGKSESCLIRDIVEIEGNQFLYERLITDQNSKMSESDLKVRHFIDNKGKGCPLCGSKVANQGVCEKVTTHIVEIHKFVKDGRRNYMNEMQRRKTEKELKEMFS